MDKLATPPAVAFIANFFQKQAGNGPQSPLCLYQFVFAEEAADGRAAGVTGSSRFHDHFGEPKRMDEQRLR